MADEYITNEMLGNYQVQGARTPFPWPFRDKEKAVLIAFTGNLGCGKSTAADFLVRRGYARIKVADTLKNMLKTLGLTQEEIEGSLKEQPCALLSGRTPRYAMQTLGSEWGRSIMDKNLWVNLWAHRVFTQLNIGVSVVTDDLRFPNEAAAVKKMGGTVVRIYRDEEKEKKHVHQSETQMDDVVPDYYIRNQGTIVQLHAAVNDMEAKIRGGNDSGPGDLA